MEFLRDLPVLVLGLGDSGLAMARWCARHGAQRDGVGLARGPAARRRAAAPKCPAARRIAGAAGVADGGAALVLKSPGLAPQDARIAPLLAEARAAGIAVLGELDLFVRALADLKAERGYAPRVLAITGTNGKTTTTAMTALLVERAGRKVVAAGNIGPTLLDTLAAQAGRPARGLGAGAVELPARRRRRGVRGFEPDAAAVLNVTQDHLDWHGSMAAYAAAKARVFGTQAVMVVNADDRAVMAMVPAPVAAKGAGKGEGQAGRARRAPLRPRTRRSARATSASSSRTAWPGWCARCPPTRP